jgi:RNA polymerase sigma-70 factor (ECF subfamily)
MTNPAHAPSLEDLLEHREWLRAIARGLVADENDVDDVEQRTWLTVLRNRRPVTSARGWLRRVVHSAAVDEHRSVSRRHAREEQSARPEALPPTDHLVVQLEAQRTIAKAVMGLPEPYRTTVLLRYIEELSVKDVSTRMSVPVKTVKTRLYRALHCLFWPQNKHFYAESDVTRSRPSTT